MLKEFKEFAMTGNVVDMAIGIMIGAAFGAIVNSLVGDIIMPIIGIVTGGLDFTERYVLLKEGTTAGPYVTLAAAKAAGAVTLNIGTFLSVVINFVLVAFALFMVVKAMNSARRKPVVPAEPPAPAPQERLLMEIRDLLRSSR